MSLFNNAVKKVPLTVDQQPDIGAEGLKAYIATMIESYPEFQEGVAYSFMVQGGILNLGLGGTVSAKKRMAVFGIDSLTEGYPGPKEEAWPAVLGAQLPDIYGKIENKGISGNTLQQFLDRMADVTSVYDFTTYEGVDVFILGGVNNLGHTADSVASLLPKYQEIITALKAPNPSKIRVYLLTLLPSNWRFYDDARRVYVTTATNNLNAEIRARAVSQWGATAVVEVDRITAFQTPTDTNLFTDQVHLTKQGNIVLGTAVATFARTGLQPMGTIPTNPVTTPDTPAGFIGLVAPTSGRSQEYDVVDQYLKRNGSWADNYDLKYWLDGHGIFTTVPGDNLVSEPLRTKNVYVQAAKNLYGNGALIELVSLDQTTVFASLPIDLNGPDGYGPQYLISLSAYGDCRLRFTNLGPGHAFMGGFSLSATDDTVASTTVTFTGNGIAGQPNPELNFATGDSPAITATVGDNAGTITYNWEQVSGPGGFIDGGPGHDAMSRTVYLGGLRQNGTYVFRVSGTKNGTPYSATVTITSNFPS